MLTKSRAIVLNMLRYNDDTLIAHVLTETEGAASMLVRINRSKRAAVRHALFRPLAVLELEWDHRPTAQFDRPRSATTALPLASLPYDPYKSSVAMFLAEVLNHAVKQNPDTAPIFQYTLRAIEWLDTAETGFANFHLVFLLRLTQFLGFAPNMESYAEGAWFDLRSAQFVLERPPHPDAVPPVQAAGIPKLLRMQFATMRHFRFAGTERSELLAHINRYYSLHLPAFPELRSLDVLKELFS